MMLAYATYIDSVSGAKLGVDLKSRPGVAFTHMSDHFKTVDFVAV